jgi:hypothetical protein
MHPDSCENWSDPLFGETNKQELLCYGLWFYLYGKINLGPDLGSGQSVFQGLQFSHPPIRKDRSPGYLFRDS